MHVLSRPQVTAQGTRSSVLARAGWGPRRPAAGREAGRPWEWTLVMTVSPQRLASTFPVITVASARTPWNCVQSWVGLCPGG